MLVLTRKEGESIIIGCGVKVQLVRIMGDRCKIGIAAPIDVPVVREELPEASKIDHSNRVSMASKLLRSIVAQFGGELIIDKAVMESTDHSKEIVFGTDRNGNVVARLQ